MKLFADDLKSYVTGNDLGSKVNFITSANELFQWANLWQLPVAFNKSSWGIIHTGNNPNTELSFGDFELAKVDEVKDLGVKFNYKLDFSSHIDDVVAKAKQRLFLLYKCIISRDPDTLIRGFKTYVLPILDYNSQIWSPHKICDILRIESVQRNFLKKLKGYGSLSYNDRLIKSDLCSLELRRLRSDLVLCFKIVHNLIPLNQKSFFTFDTTSRTRGNMYKIKLTFAKSKARFNFFASRVVNIWNSLPNIVVCSENIFEFKKRICVIDFSKFLILQCDRVER